MRVDFRTLAAALVTGAVLALPTAAAIHPVTGRSLAEDRAFTYRSEEVGSADLQLAQDVASTEIISDLFEGLTNQDADGNLEPRLRAGLRSR